MTVIDLPARAFAARSLPFAELVADSCDGVETQSTPDTSLGDRLAIGRLRVEDVGGEELGARVRGLPA